MPDHPIRGANHDAEAMSQSRRQAHDPAGPQVRQSMLAKFINMVMERGKKSVAESIVYGALDASRTRAARRRSADRSARESARQRRADGRSEVPPRRRRDLPGAGRSSTGASPDTGDALAGRSRVEARSRSRWRSGWPARCSTPPRIAARAVKKREDTHRMAEANKAFAHYRW